MRNAYALLRYNLNDVITKLRKRFRFDKNVLRFQMLRKYLRMKAIWFRNSIRLYVYTVVQVAKSVTLSLYKEIDKIKQHKEKRGQVEDLHLKPLFTQVRNGKQSKVNAGNREKTNESVAHSKSTELQNRS